MADVTVDKINLLFETLGAVRDVIFEFKDFIVLSAFHNAPTQAR